MEKELLDVVIVGSGPAGLSAAIYCARSNLKVLVLEASVNGGKLYKTYEIDNYPGISKIGGVELAQKLIDHVKDYDVNIKAGEVLKLDDFKEYKTLTLKNGEVINTKTVIVATGTKERELDLPHSKEFTGRGISYCAVCDGFFYRKKDVVIIGGGNSALEESLYLASLCNSVTIVIRRDVFRGEQSLVDKVKANEKIKVISKHLPQELIIENDMISCIKLRNVDTNEITEIKCSGIFPYIGADPCSDFLDSSILDEKGYLIVNPDMSTNIKGIYGAGDVIQKELRQVITACNDGAIAANSIAKYLRNN